jgi:hypothetical protein
MVLVWLYNLTRTYFIKNPEKEKWRAERATPPSGSPPDGGQNPQNFQKSFKRACAKSAEGGQLRNQFLRALLPC